MFERLLTLRSRSRFLDVSFRGRPLFHCRHFSARLEEKSHESISGKDTKFDIRNVESGAFFEEYSRCQPRHARLDNLAD